MKELIYREDALNFDMEIELDEDEDIESFCKGAQLVMEHIKAVPAAVERPKGKWILHGEPPWETRECSECGEEYNHWCGAIMPKFCPNCGAEMERD